MMKLLMIADDFTGAIDSGVQFSKNNIPTCVLTDAQADFAGLDPSLQVLVLDTETRHLPAAEAHDLIYQVVQRAVAAGIPYIYKKTDSVLRGNIGAELAAVLEASGEDSLPFVPAYPQNGRITRDGVHYVQGTPVAESVFGQDPFEPVRFSRIDQIIAQQTAVPAADKTQTTSGIRIFDAETDQDLRKIGTELSEAGLHISAGCAGFASVVAEILPLERRPRPTEALETSVFVVCGSLNPVTLKQLDCAEQSGFLRFRLTPEEKLREDWMDSPACEKRLEEWLELAAKGKKCILDSNDADGNESTFRYMEEQNLSISDARIGISRTLGRLVKRLLDRGLEATLFCSGGDTLLAVMREMGTTQILPVREESPGIVRSVFTYRGKKYHVISKSGGFGEPDLLNNLTSQIQAVKEDIKC